MFKSSVALSEDPVIRGWRHAEELRGLDVDTRLGSSRKFADEVKEHQQVYCPQVRTFADQRL